MVPTQVNSLLEEPQLSVLIAKNAIRPSDRYRLNEVKMDDLYDNAIHYTMESALCTYLAKEWNKDKERIWNIGDK